MDTDCLKSLYGGYCEYHIPFVWAEWTILFKANMNNCLNILLIAYAAIFVAVVFYYCCVQPISKIQKRITKSLVV